MLLLKRVKYFKCIPNVVAYWVKLICMLTNSLWLSNFQAAVYLNLEDLEMDYGEVRVSAGTSI